MSSGFRLDSCFRMLLPWLACSKRRAVVEKARKAILDAIFIVRRGGWSWDRGRWERVGSVSLIAASNGRQSCWSLV